MNVLLLSAGLLLVSVTTCAAGAEATAYQVAPHSNVQYCAIASSQFAQGELMRAHLIDPNKVDDKKTQITLLAKQPLFKNIWKAVYDLKLQQTDGKSMEVIIVTTSYYGECPGDKVKTYVVSHSLGELPSLKYLPNVPDGAGR